MDKQKHNIIAKKHRDRKREYYKNLEKENKILKETLKNIISHMEKIQKFMVINKE